MKKFWEICISLVLTLACFMGVACGNSGLDVESKEFYDNFVEQALAIDKLVYDYSKTTSDATPNSSSVIRKVKEKGGFEFAESGITSATETINTRAQADNGLETYRSEKFEYVYNGKSYNKSGRSYSGETLSYEYEVSNFNQVWITKYFSEMKQVMNFINEKEDGGELAQKVLESLFTASKTDEGYKLALDAQKVQIFYNDLKTLTVKQVVDKYLGEGAFESLKTEVLGLLDKTLNQVKVELDEYSDGKFDKFLEDVVGIILEAEGETETTAKQMIDEVLKEYGEIKISNLIGDEQELKAEIGAIFGALETSNMFYILGLSTEIIDGYITDYADDVKFEILFDKDGIIQGVNIDVNITLDEKKTEIFCKVEFGKQFENIASKTSSILANIEQ